MGRLQKVLAAGAVLFAIYLPVGIYLSNSYVPTGLVRYTMSRPFVEVEPGQYLSLEEFKTVTPTWITPEEASKTPIIVYEGKTPVGAGQWKLGTGILFSRSDGANPNNGGIKYYISMPPFVDREYVTNRDPQ